MRTRMVLLNFLITQLASALFGAFAIWLILGLCFVSTSMASTSKTSGLKSGSRSSTKVRQPSQNLNRASQASVSVAASGKKLTASGLYQKAREYFQAGRYKEAIQYAAAAQRRTSSSKLPTALVAQSYYRLGNVARAAKLFLSLQTQEIPRDAAVDYLFTMFAVKRYSEVTRVYPLIPDNHPYRDIARFYLGSSFIQLRQYSKASKALRAAKRIPAELKSERRKLLSYIRQQQQIEREGIFENTPQYYGQWPMVSLPPPVEAAPIPSALPGGVPAKPTAPKPSPPKAGFVLLVAPSLSLGIRSVREDNNGYLLKQTDSQSPTIAFNLGLKYLGEPRSFGGQPSIDFGFKPSISNSESKTSTSKLTASEDDPTNVQNVATRTESKSEKTIQDFSISGLLPLSEPVDIGVNFGLVNTESKAPAKSISTKTSYGINVTGDFDFVDFSAGQSIAATEVKGVEGKSEEAITKVALTFAREDYTTSLSLSSTNLKPAIGVKAVTDIDLSWSKEFGDFGLELAASKTDRQRLPLTAEKTILSQTDFSGEVSYSIGAGLSASLTGIMTQIGGMPILKDETISEGPDEVLASGDAKQFVALIKYAPASFASASVVYDYTDRVLKVSDSNFKMKLLKNTWSQLTSTSINLNLSYSF